MEYKQRDGRNRYSGSHERHVQSVQRRTSKKTSSRDRHGQVYPDDFRETSIRAVTPDSAHESSSNGLTSRSAFMPSSISTSPQPARRHSQHQMRDLVQQPRPVSNGFTIGMDRNSPFPPRTRTSEENVRDRSPSSLISRTRQRIGSLHATGSSPIPGPNDDITSIGFPSIIPSPPLPSQNRQRLIKPRARPLSTIKDGSTPHRTVSQATSQTDPGKVLDLMKTTCGRMHGILSFRTSSSCTWASGYCAINVASGSLIYQTKGIVSHAKTLIPDLRGCRVRTLYDRDSESTYLDVSTHASVLGLHLRPHVPETFDSWLAALLCWQPIRPKGVHNKMTKPQAAIVANRRSGDHRRNPEVSTTKDASIIKVGKMLFWDKNVRPGTSASEDSWRVSTYKQQRSISRSWQKVSCTLQENGNFKLFTESDVSLVSIIPLSELSRCAIQRLDPSVLEDEFSLAIYPQYTLSTSKLDSTKPVYLSMESRVLFEVWFVLLRAFTIPELYGPQQILIDPQPSQSALPPAASVGPAPDMFRIERLLSIRIIEAKLWTSDGDRSQSPTSQPRHQKSRKNWVTGDYHAEVRLDGDVRTKTAVKSDTSNPFWREDYNFIDLPPVLSSASVDVKSRTAGQRDWTLIARGSYDSKQRDVNSLDAFGDIEISPLESLYGKVDLRLDDLERSTDNEKRWPVVNENDEVVGEMLMKVRIEELVVLMSRDYQPLSELLHSFSNGVTLQIAKMLSSEELRSLSEILLNIFQVSAQSSDWIMSLVEDEIDGIHRESQVSRFRYSRRIASNDSYDSGVEREMFLRDLGKSATVEANLLFRGNSLLTKALDLHMRRLGKEYLEDTLSEKMRDIDESDPDCEVDPNRLQRPEDLQRNWRNLIALTENVWRSIYTSASRCPPELRTIFRHIRACAEDRYGDFHRTVTYSSVSGFLFLRFFCPAVLNPKLFGLLKEHSRPRAQRTLTLIAKALQTLANLTTFGSKEPWMEPMNAFLTSHRQEFKFFVDAICAISADRATSSIPPSYATPITILSRLPDTSREGFPSLPYLIDQAKECAALVRLWLHASHDLDNNANTSEELVSFDDLCKTIRQKKRDCLSRAEQAERPSGVLEVKWEELVEQMGKKTQIRDNQHTSTPSTPVSGAENGSTTSLADGYFTQDAVPRGSPQTRRTADDDYFPFSNEDEDTPPGSSSGVWDPGVLEGKSNQYYLSENEGNASVGSSLYSLDLAAERGAHAGGNRAPASRDGAGKLRLGDFVGGFRRRVRESERGEGSMGFV